MHLLHHPRSGVTILVTYSQQRGGIGEISANQCGHDGGGEANTAIQGYLEDALIDVSMIAIRWISAEVRPPQLSAIWVSMTLLCRTPKVSRRNNSCPSLQLLVETSLV